MNDKKSNIEKQDKISFSLPINKKTLKFFAALLFMMFLFYVIVAKPQIISTSISFVLDVISPFLIGCCIAYVVNLIMRPFERFWTWVWRRCKKQNIISKFKRPVCLTFSILIVLGTLFAIVFMVIPAIKDAVVSFAKEASQHAQTLEGWYQAVVDFLANYNFDMPEISFNTANIGQMASEFITNYGNNVLDSTVQFTTSVFSVVVDVVLGVVFAVYLLAQKEKLARQTTKVIRALLKPKRAEKFINFTSLTNSVFSKFVTGQLLEACIIGTLCFIGMLIFGMPYAIIISVLVGFTALIPFFGAFIGTGIGAFLILLEDPSKVIWFIIFIIVLQQLEGNIIYPRVVGKSVGLPGIWVLAAVTVGGGLFGILGMLFSVPICSVLYVVFRKFVNKRNGEYETQEEQKAEATE